jgi:hypothetical protein
MVLAGVLIQEIETKIVIKRQKALLSLDSPRTTMPFAKTNIQRSKYL